MMIASRSARLIVLTIALILVLPIAGIRLQNNAALEQFHRHSLSPWPLPANFLADPVHYFASARAWLADRVYPIAQTSALVKGFLYFELDTPPQRFITLGDNGFVFLNGSSDASVNSAFESVCVAAHSPATAAGVQNSLTDLARYADASGLAFDVVVVPISATLYGDQVPASVPPRLRSACQERAHGGSPLLYIRPPGGVHYVFPFPQMKAASDDEAFFPKGNWHATGLSLKIVRDAYLASLDIHARIDETLQRGSAPSEVLGAYGGVTKNLPVYVLHNAHVSADAGRNTLLAHEIAGLFPNPNIESRYYKNSQPAISQSILIISDSYGNLTSEVFAGAFQNVFQITGNVLAADRIEQVIQRVSKLEHFDRVVLLTEEGQVGIIIRWAQALGAAAAKEKISRPLPDSIFKMH